MHFVRYIGIQLLFKVVKIPPYIRLKDDSAVEGLDKLERFVTISPKSGPVGILSFDLSYRSGVEPDLFLI